MAISMVSVSLVPTAMTFKAKTHHAIHTRKNHHHSLRITLVRKKCILTADFQQLLFYGIDAGFLDLL